MWMREWSGRKNGREDNRKKQTTLKHQSKEARIAEEANGASGLEDCPLSSPTF
jgi:hypothetical protein